MKKKKHNSTGKFWIDNLVNIAEKYCKHDNREPYGSCLYFIIIDFLEENKFLDKNWTVQKKKK